MILIAHFEIDMRMILGRRLAYAFKLPRTNPNFM
jgi:hypothetical protein